MPPRAVTYQLRVALKGARPPIWRRFLVPPTITLESLHDVLQVVMGWHDGHLHMFIKGRQRFSLPNPWMDDWAPMGGPRELDERGYRVNQLLKREKDWIDYEYDFGDGWTHRITLQKILPRDPQVRLPACVAGKRQCPPEDCGGIWGFYEKLRILEDPDDEEYEDIREWMGDDFDPDDFSVDEVNAQLRGMFR